MTKLPRVFLFLVALAAGLAAAPARADDAMELERGKSSYDAGRYAEGVERFREMLNPAAPNALREPNAIERARSYYAACLIALGRSSEADAEIEKLIRANPVYSPDPVAFPSKVVDRFIEIKSRLKQELEAASRARAAAEQAAKAKIEQQQREYIESLQRLASQETVVVRHSRWIAMLPFGIGQFQNGQDGLGYAFLVAQSALAVTSIVSGMVEMHLVANYTELSTPAAPGEPPKPTPNFEKFNSEHDTALAVNRYSTGALAVFALAGIIHAQVAYVPEVQETRVRPLPPPPPVLTPKVGAGPSGFFLGLSGRF
jgi:tetratricopeptide (TPR) repeat protein